MKKAIRPKQFSSDKEFIERLITINTKLSIALELYLEHYGSYYRNRLKYWQLEASKLHNQIFQLNNNNNMSNEISMYVIHNTTLKLYLCYNNANRCDYFNQDIEQAKRIEDLNYATYLRDQLQEQYPQYNFEIVEI